MARKRVGDLLLEAGVITAEQLGTALKEQKKTHDRLGNVLLKLNFIDEDKLSEVLAHQSGANFVDLTEISISPETAKLLPKSFCMENKVIPLSKDGNRIVVAMSDPFDIVTLDMVTLFTGSEVQVAVAREREIVDAIEKFCFEEELELVPSGGGERKEDLSDIAFRSEIKDGQDLSKISPEKIFIPLETLRMVPQEFCTNNKIIPLRKGDNYLLIGMADPSDIVTLDMLKVMTGLEIRTVPFSEEDIMDLLARFYHDDLALEELVSVVSDETSVEVVRSDFGGDFDSSESSIKNIDLQSLRNKSETGPVIRLANSLVIEAIKMRASDIHIEPREAATQVRCRVDGLLKNMTFLPSFVHARLISRFKIMSGMDISETRNPQDGRCRVRMGKNEYDMRVSTVPTFYGEKLVMRILDQSAGSIGLENIGFCQEDYDKIITAITQQQGIILVTGPTGSGKSSTLFSILEVLKSETKNIITVEDPIEYDITGINQMQVNEKAGLTFASLLRHILRQDPDVVMVGEIRDEETAEIAFHAAMTGHLVLSTLHTNDAPTTVIRLRELAVSPYLVAASLKAVVAQRLVRTICSKCREAYPAPREVVEMLGMDYSDDLKFYKGKGCKTCGFTGYHGRTGIFEVLTLDDKIQDLIYKEVSTIELADAASKQGMKFLMQDAMNKVKKGITTPEEVLRVISRAEIIQHGRVCPRCNTRIQLDYTVCPKCGLDLEKRKCPNCGKELEEGLDICPNCDVPKASIDISQRQPAMAMSAGVIPPPGAPVNVSPVQVQEAPPSAAVCPNCGADVDPNWVRCAFCDHVIAEKADEPDPAEERECPGCGRMLSSDWVSCPFCGASFVTKEEPEPEPVAAQPQPSYQAGLYQQAPPYQQQYQPPYPQAYPPPMGYPAYGQPGYYQPAPYAPPAPYPYQYPPAPQTYPAAQKVCPSCNQPVNPQWRLCPYCAANLGQNMVQQGAVCSNCKSPLQPGWKICPSCESPVEAAKPQAYSKCPSCNSQVKAEWKMCPTCAMPLTAPSYESSAKKEQMCSKCSAKLNPEWAACPFCQTPVGVAKKEETGNSCPFCGARVEAGWNFCSNCQRRIDTREMDKGLPPKPVIPEPQVEAEVVPLRKDKSRTRDKKRILVVDDEAKIQNLLKKVLESNGYEVEVVSDGSQALQKITSSRPDLVITDTTMPGSDGFELCSRIKQNSQLASIPVIMLFSWEHPDHELKGMEAGADDFIQKPLYQDKILTKVNLVLKKFKNDQASKETTLDRVQEQGGSSPSP
ncbi:MAG: Flp pilus assembly complex ATPase component TadA [Chloroflexi bacterium]|nr:Flp pilus assembly complex ATPase component TadA [Chloroflexota bacterium]